MRVCIINVFVYICVCVCVGCNRFLNYFSPVPSEHRVEAFHLLFCTLLCGIHIYIFNKFSILDLALAITDA